MFESQQVTVTYRLIYCMARTKAVNPMLAGPWHPNRHFIESMGHGLMQVPRHENVYVQDSAGTVYSLDRKQLHPPPQPETNFVF